MSHIEILTAIAGTMEQPRYLEIGIGDFGCFNSVVQHCQYGFAVDVDDNPYGEVVNRISFPEKTYFLTCGSNIFFDTLPRYERFDLVFIDGCHHAEQVRRDFYGALDHLSDLGVIAMHDTWSPTKELAIQGSDTAWQVAAELEMSSDFEAFTLPRRPGLTFVRPRVSRFE